MGHKTTAETIASGFCGVGYEEHQYPGTRRQWRLHFIHMRNYHGEQMSEFARLKNSEQFYKVKIEQQERQLHDLQMERQAMHQVIGAMITMNPDTVENGIRSITLDEHFIGQNYAIVRVDSPETQTFKYIANIITERGENE